MTFTRSKRTYKRYVPIYRRNASRKAARKRTPSLTNSTSDCAVWVRSWRTKRSGTAFSRFVLQTARLPFVACNELAIATKSIASVLSPATRSPWVPFQGGTARGKTREERGNFNLEFSILHSCRGITHTWMRGTLHLPPPHTLL